MTMLHCEELQTGGATLRYVDQGAGDPIVFVHGHPFDHTMWQPQLAAFAGQFRVIAPDLRGYGRSTGGIEERTTMEVFASDVEKLLDHLGLEQAILCGLSMAGQIVMQCLHQIPGRVRAVILADTTAHAESEQGKRDREQTAVRLEREGMGPYAREVLPIMVDPANIAELPEVADHVLKMMVDTDPAAAAAALRGRAARRDYLDVLRHSDLPALVVVGDADRFTPVEDALDIARALPDSTLAVIPGAAHLPNLERPAIFDSVLTAFLARVQNAATTCTRS